MRLGADTNTRWLWFITYILLPLNVIAQIFGLFWLLDADQGGIGILFIIAELGLAIATIIGLHQFKPWGWYCIMVMFGIQLIGTPLKVHAKASMRYEVTQAANSYLQSQGRSPLTASKPSIFDFEPMLTFVFLLAIWTIPNAIYLYRRRHLFGIETQSFPNLALDPMFPSKSTSPMPRQSNSMMVSDEEERAYADARRELDSGNVREGLWAKVCAEETEDERRKAQYLRYRAQQIWYAKNTAKTEARRKTTNASIRHWTWFVAKRIAIGFLLFLTWSVVSMFIPMRFLYQHYSDNYGYWELLMWIRIIPSMLIVFGFPIYLVRSIVRESRRRKAAHFGGTQSSNTHQRCKMNPAQE